MDKTHYNIDYKIKTAWAELAAAKRIKDTDMAAYMITRAMFAKSNDKLEVAKALLLRAFTPITNTNKLNNGCTAFEGLQRAIRYANWSPIAKLLEGEHLDTFRSLCKALEKEEWSDTTYCYIITRSDLPPIHRLVQTAHATMMAGQRYPGFDASKLHFCILDGGNEESLRELGKKMMKRKMDFATFWEPDAKALWNGLPRKEITSLACRPMRKSVAKRKKLFDELPLLTTE